ncbi:MAG: NAD(P)-binding protein [Anaerolineae bacterium]|nr:NAD(P)-binding protein [Anaerolineae bacterium]
MVRNERMKVVVLGAGPAGLCAAWNLVKDGHHVIVLEREPVCGGQAITFEKDGYRYDLGPHNIHSRHASITEFLGRNLGDQFIEWKLRAQLYFHRKRIDYPLVGLQVLKSLPPLTVVACGISFFASRVRSLFVPGFRDDGTYERWIVNRFGRRFYNIFFGPYSQKAWGIKPSELSDVVAIKRVAVRSITELLLAIVFRKEKLHLENPRLIKNYYPRCGVGTIIDFFTRDILRDGGKILTGCEVVKIHLNGNHIDGLTYRNQGQEHFLDFAADHNNWHVLSTIPINDMVLMMGDQAPSAAAEAARGLDFTSEVFLYLNINKPDVFNIPLLYFGELEFPFNRIYDVGLFSRDMVPPGKNAVCIELTCGYGDETWRMSADQIFEKCITALEKHHLLQRSQIEGYHIRRLQHAYPRFRVGYQKKVGNILQFVKGIDNLMTFGRQGLFSYANVDDVIWMGFEVAKYLRYRDRISLSLNELLPDYVDPNPI